MAKKITELPVSQTPNDADLYVVVQSADTRKQTLGQIKQSILGANLTALSGLTGAADRLAYFNGVGSMALTPLTSAARGLLDDANSQDMRTTLGIPWAGATSSTAATDLDIIAETSVLGITTSTLNVPAGILNGSMVATDVFGPTSKIQIIESRSSDRILFRRMVSGAWQTWVELAVISTAGVNSNITSLTGLSTPLSTAQGGTNTNTSTGSGANALATAPTLNQPNVVGVTTNSNAAAGSVGEFISSTVASGSAVALTSGANINVTSISLTPGDWDVQGNVGFVPAGTTTTSAIGGAISTTSAAVPTPPSSGGYSFLSLASPAGASNLLPVGRTRLSLAVTTTVYLVAQSTFAVSTSGAYGFIGARRVR